jgi:hypothetical protein
MATGSSHQGGLHNLFQMLAFGKLSSDVAFLTAKPDPDQYIPLVNTIIVDVSAKKENEDVHYHEQAYVGSGVDFRLIIQCCLCHFFLVTGDALWAVWRWRRLCMRVTAAYTQQGEQVQN